MNTRLDRVARMFEDDNTADPLDDSATPTAANAPAGEEPVYAFEGYTVDFNTKVVLMPVQPVSSPAMPARGAARGSLA